MTPDLKLGRRLVNAPYTIARWILRRHPALRCIEETKHNATPIRFDSWFKQFILGNNYGPYWPVHPTSSVYNWRNVRIGIDVAPGFTPGCYIQAFGLIEIGDYTRIGPNVGIISANHDVYDGRIHHPTSIKIGDYCWLGMNSIVLPDVTLGDFTVVAAGASVTRSFAEGYCVIGGVPARVIRRLEPERCVRYENRFKYYGYVTAENFTEFRKKNLNPAFSN